MSHNYFGNWKITVTQKQAAFDQRFVITGSKNSDGYHDGIIGNILNVNGLNGWEITIQHNDGSGWDDSLMRLQPMIENGANLTQIIESEDLPERPDPIKELLILQLIYQKKLISH